MANVISLSCLSIGMIGLMTILSILFLRLKDNKRIFGVGTSLLSFIFSGIMVLGIFIGIDDIKQTKVTENILSKIIKQDSEKVNSEKSNKEVAEGDFKADNPSKELSVLNSNQADIKTQENKGVIVSTNSSNNNENTPSNIPTDNNQSNNNSNSNNSSSGSSASPVDNNSGSKSNEAIEVLEHNVVSNEQGRTRISYTVRNNTNRPMAMKGYMITTFSENGAPVMMQITLDNLLYVPIQGTEREIKPSEVVTFYMYIDNGAVSKFKMIITDGIYLDNSETWKNPNKKSFYESRHTY